MHAYSHMHKMQRKHPIVFLHGEILSSIYIPYNQPHPSVLLYIARPALVALDHSVQVTIVP